MKKNMENFTDIFFSPNLKEQSFYFHCSHLEEETKNQIIQTIIKYNGVRFILFIYIYKNINIEIRSFLKSKDNSSNK